MVSLVTSHHNKLSMSSLTVASRQHLPTSATNEGAQWMEGIELILQQPGRKSRTYSTILSAANFIIEFFMS